MLYGKKIASYFQDFKLAEDMVLQFSLVMKNHSGIRLHHTHLLLGGVHFSNTIFMKALKYKPSAQYASVVSICIVVCW